MPTNESAKPMTARLATAFVLAITVFPHDSKSQFFCVKRNQLDTKGTAGLGKDRFQGSVWKEHLEQDSSPLVKPGRSDTAQQLWQSRLPKAGGPW
jgi:hypothetical protein